MDFYKKVLDSMDRISDSNERLAEYLDGVLNAKGLESFVSVTPHKDGYRLQIAGKYSPLYVDVYLDGEDLVLGGSQIGSLSDGMLKELATFLGIPEKEVAEKADRFASVIRYLIAHNHRPVDELAKVKDDGESDEVAEKVEEVFADFAAHAPEDRDVRHVDLVAYGTPITLRFQTAEKNKDRLDVYAAVDGDIDVEADRQYVGSDSIANKGRAVIKALMGGILVDLAGKAAVKEAEAEKKAAVEAGAFDADVLLAKIKEMHEDLQNLPAGAKQEIMVEVENADHEVKLMFTPGEAEGSVAFIMDVDGKPHEIGEYLISNKMLPYFAVSDLLRVADKVLGIEIADSCGKTKDDTTKGSVNGPFTVEADITRMLEDFRSGSKDARVLEYDDINGHSVQLTVIPSRGGRQMDIYATIDGASPTLLSSASTEDMRGAAQAAIRLYNRLLPIDDSVRIKDDESKGKNAFGVEADIMRMMEDFRTGSKDTRVLEYDNLEGHNVRLTVIPSKDGKRMTVYATLDGGVPTFIAEQLINAPLASAKVLNSLYDKIMPVGDSARVKDDESKGKNAFGVEADIMRMMADFRTGSKDARVLEYDNLEGHNVRLTVIPSGDGKRMEVYATIDGGVPTFLTTQLIDAPLSSTKVLNSLYDKILPIQEDSKVKDDEHAAPESALVPLSDAVNAMRNDRSIKTKVANVDYLGSNVSFILTRKVDKDKGLVHVYVRNGKDAPMKFMASYDLDGIGVADRMFHAGLKELGIEDSCGKKKDDTTNGSVNGPLSVEADIMRMMEDFRAGSHDARVLEYDNLEGHNVRLTVIPSRDGKRMEVYATVDGGAPTFLTTQLIDAPLASTKVLNSLYDKILPIQEDSKDKKPVCDDTAHNLERMQKRVASALAGENGGRAYAMRSYGKDKTLASAAIKVAKDGDIVTGIDVAYIYTTPTIDIVVDEHYDIPAGDAPEKELGAKIDARFDELGKIAVDTYEGKITEDKAKELIGGNVEIEHDIVPSSINMVRDADPKEADPVGRNVVGNERLKFFVIAVSGNGDSRIIFESKDESTARLRYSEEVAKAGEPVDTTGWTDSDQAWKSLYHIELLKLTLDEEGVPVDNELLDSSEYFKG